jgi:outer membrane immunogenic protein
MLKKIALTAGVMVSLSAMAVSAADLPRKSVAPAFAPAPLFTWTGFYVGLNGGWGQTRYKEKDTGFNLSSRGNGGLVGGTIGYNYQLANNVVAGLEADAAYAFIEKKYQLDFSTPGFVDRVDLKTETSFFGTVRGRFGYSFGSVMPYLTGGMAVATHKLSGTDTFGPVPGALVVDSTSAKKTVVGWTLGGGVEMMLTRNITAKAEYLYADFGAKRFNFSQGAGSAKVETEMHVVRAGLNYKF